MPKIKANIRPFLTLPTACRGALPFTFRELGGWQDPAAESEVTSKTHDADGAESGFVGCEQMRFEPFTDLEIGTQQADTGGDPLGKISTSLATYEDPTALSPETVKALTVTPPEGFVVNPGQASGLQACGVAESAWTTAREHKRREENDGPAQCPAASKLGTVLTKSPLIEGAEEKQLEGNVYLLPSNPPEVKLLVAASADGVNVKLVLKAELNESTGQITTTVENAPELPVSDFKLTLFGGGA